MKPASQKPTLIADVMPALAAQLREYMTAAAASGDDAARDTFERLAEALGNVDGYWTQQQCAAFLNVSTRYLRDSSCPRVTYPGNGKAGKQVVRYDPADVRAWARNFREGSPRPNLRSRSAA